MKTSRNFQEAFISQDINTNLPYQQIKLKSKSKMVKDDPILTDLTNYQLIASLRQNKQSESVKQL